MSGSDRLRRAIQRLRAIHTPTPPDDGRVQPDRPRPETAWGWLVEQRLGRIEDQLTWLTRLAASALLGVIADLIIRLLT